LFASTEVQLRRNISATTRYVFLTCSQFIINTPEFGQPTNLSYTNTTGFSEITSLRNGPRVLQLALKLFF
jgi:hypothetical protein